MNRNRRTSRTKYRDSFNFDLGLEKLASASTSWFSLGLGLDLMTLASASASRFWPHLTSLADDWMDG